MKILIEKARALLFVGAIAISSFACASQANLESNAPKDAANSTAKTATVEQKQTAASNSVVQPNGATQQPVSAQNPTAKNAGNVELSLPFDASAATAGSVVTIPVVIASKDKKEIFSYTFAVRFDPNVLKPAQPEIETTGTLSGNGFQVVSDTQTSGRLGVAAASSGKTIPANGTLLKARFTVVGKSSGKMNLKLENPVFEDIDGNSINVTAKTNQQ